MRYMHRLGQAVRIASGTQNGAGNNSAAQATAWIGDQPGDASASPGCGPSGYRCGLPAAVRRRASAMSPSAVALAIFLSEDDGTEASGHCGPLEEGRGV